MATITEATTTHDGQLSKVVSDPATVATADTVDIVVPAYSSHLFLGVKMYDSGGALIAAGAATGTFTVATYTENTGLPETQTVSTVDAADPATIDWFGNTNRVTVSGASLSAGIITWVVTVTANRS
tara:strand:+ start:283 stop:660 length:378 start_codon:yes stop_codon:yes gene_type:complete